MLFILVTIVIAYLIYSCYNNLTYWKREGVCSVTPWPIFGNLASAAFGKRAIPQAFQDIYNSFPNERYIGFYNFAEPNLMLRDPEIIKKIVIKELDSFPEHREFIPDGIDPIWCNNLFAMRGGERWLHQRSTLSPAFTSCKLKMMYGLIKERSTAFTSHLLKNKGTVTIELKDIFSKYSNDVIATTSFGLVCDSLENPDNDFYRNGRSLLTSGGVQVASFAYLMFPTIATLLKLKMFPKEVGQFFTSIIRDTIKYREENSIRRPDLLDSLIETKKKQEQDPSSFKPQHIITVHDITAQALGFYFAGFDSTSTMMCHAAFEIALYPEVQEKLRRKVDAAFEKCNGDITYEALSEIKYLDMILSETLRKWPSFIENDRLCKKPFTIEPKNPGEKPLHIKPGTVIYIPLYALQRDPQYFPNPDTFDPERFSDENKHKINTGVYAPFGGGLKACLGPRLVFLEAKLMLCDLISKFELIPSKKTQVPIKLKKNDLNPLPEDGFWVELKPRQK